MSNSSLKIKKDLLPIPPFRVMANNFMSPSVSIDQDKMKISASTVKIENLEHIVSNNKQLSFALMFPLDEECKYTIYATDSGFTKIHIINEIRRAFRAMFRHSNKTSSKWETVSKDNIITSYLVSYPYSGVFVEEIYINREKSELEIICNCTPEIVDKDNLPF